MLMVVDGCLQGQETAETLGGGPWPGLGVVGPGKVHLREGAVVEAEYHRVAATAFDAV